MNARLSSSVIVSVISCASGSRDDGRTAAPRRTPCFANLQMQPCLRVHDHPGITACPTDMTHALARVRLSSGAIVSGKTGEPLLIPDRLRRHLPALYSSAVGAPGPEFRRWAPGASIVRQCPVQPL